MNPESRKLTTIHLNTGPAEQLAKVNDSYNKGIYCYKCYCYSWLIVIGNVENEKWATKPLFVEAKVKPQLCFKCYLMLDHT